MTSTLRRLRQVLTIVLICCSLKNGLTLAVYLNTNSYFSHDYIEILLGKTVNFDGLMAAAAAAAAEERNGSNGGQS